MSRTNFRYRNVDPTKHLPLYTDAEIIDLNNRAFIGNQQHPLTAGMEREEESETHLQDALTHQQTHGTTGAQVIPIPEIEDVVTRYQQYYPPTFKSSKQLVRTQTVLLDKDGPDYDLDSEDETWLAQHGPELSLDADVFENLLEKLERNCTQQLLEPHEVKAILRREDNTTAAVYEYWISRRRRESHALLPQVKQDKRDGSTQGDPYVAFRRRAEKMQTRKNRKNDEASYEKLVKLRRDFGKLMLLLEFLKRREKLQKERVDNWRDIFSARVAAEDWTGKLYQSAVHKQRAPVIPRTVSVPPSSPRKTLPSVAGKAAATGIRKRHRTESGGGGDLERALAELADDSLDGEFQLKRLKGACYMAPRSPSPADVTEEISAGDSRQDLRYCLTSLATSSGREMVGSCRRRLGRGGRILFSRAFNPPPTARLASFCWEDLTADSARRFQSFITSHDVSHCEPVSPITSRRLPTPPPSPPPRSTPPPSPSLPDEVPPQQQHVESLSYRAPAVRQSPVQRNYSRYKMAPIDHSSYTKQHPDDIAAVWPLEEAPTRRVNGDHTGPCLPHPEVNIPELKLPRPLLHCHNLERRADATKLPNGIT